jgi:putative nucleotidyltransferase with HDIG domain
MTDGSHKHLETPTHRLRVLAIIASFGLVATGLGAVLGSVGRQEGLSDNAAIAAGAIMALGAFAVGSSAVPFAHWLLGDIGTHRLIAAASPLHPLLKRLMSEAPGTYVHSVAVANLSEAAAESVGADQLLARVAAYYHDVGKLVRPCYFFENAEANFNPHEQTQPAASVGIITAHVDDGIALAQQYRLPAPVLQIIREHHGTSLVRYFYHKAAEADASVFESDFRYRGSHPHTKESAIVMLADASEASVRAMIDPDPERIEASVRAVFAERLSDGQLDESGLDDDDFETMIDAFVRNLVSFRHVRCQYPVEKPMECGACR